MPPKSAIADAWDDDWESLADKQDAAGNEPAPDVKLSKAERRAKHAEFNRQIWESAENPEPKLFLEARNNAPVLSAFKPAMTLLARKPPQVLSRNGAASGLADLSLDDDDDSEEERRRKNEADFEERKARAQQERAEKERKYAEAREKIFGSENASDNSRGASPNKSSRGKARARGGRDSQPHSDEQSPARPLAPSRQLYEPSYSPKPGSLFVQKKESSISRPSTPNEQEKPLREPRGPTSSGRGGFASRGNRTGMIP